MEVKMGGGTRWDQWGEMEVEIGSGISGKMR
jgi:hypothetical protein